VDQVARLVGERRVLANAEFVMSARPLLSGTSRVNAQFIAEAEGCRVVDTTGCVYVDLPVGWGSALLGYGCRRSMTRFESNSLPRRLSRCRARSRRLPASEKPELELGDRGDVTKRAALGLFVRTLRATVRFTASHFAPATAAPRSTNVVVDVKQVLWVVALLQLAEARVVGSV
jgi:hypothetical protein